jgi:hypothetical protein
MWNCLATRLPIIEIMRTAKYVVPVGILFAGLFFVVPQSEAKPEYSKKEKKSCVTCHVKNGAKELNDAGKHYKEKGALPPAK